MLRERKYFDADELNTRNRIYEKNNIYRECALIEGGNHLVSDY